MVTRLGWADAGAEPAKGLDAAAPGRPHVRQPRDRARPLGCAELTAVQDAVRPTLNFVEVWTTVVEPLTRFGARPEVLERHEVAVEVECVPPTGPRPQRRRLPRHASRNRDVVRR